MKLSSLTLLFALVVGLVLVVGIAPAHVALAQDAPAVDTPTAEPPTETPTVLPPTATPTLTPVPPTVTPDPTATTAPVPTPTPAPVPIPEPVTTVLFGTGLAALAGAIAARRRKG
jgi:outer membrane biosynthesis protein TonB